MPKEKISINIHPLPNDLSSFIKDCETDLLDGTPIEFFYPDECKGDLATLDSFAKFAGDIKKLNDKTLRSLRGKANVYAIFERAGCDGSWSVVYVGKSKRNEMRTRIQNHLISKNKKTGAKLNNVIEAIQDGKSIGVNFILVEKESLREFIEQSIFTNRKEKSWWNIQE